MSAENQVNMLEGMKDVAFENFVKAMKDGAGKVSDKDCEKKGAAFFDYELLNKALSGATNLLCSEERMRLSRLDLERVASFEEKYLAVMERVLRERAGELNLNVADSEAQDDGTNHSS